MDTEHRTRDRFYSYLVKFITENGYSPSVREIADGTNLHSTSTVFEHLKRLEILGKIKMQEGKSRTIKLVGYKFVKDTKEDM